MTESSGHYVTVDARYMSSGQPSTSHTSLRSIVGIPPAQPVLSLGEPRGVTHGTADFSLAFEPSASGCPAIAGA